MSKRSVTIASPTASEWGIFLQLARLEGWRVPPREVALFQGHFAEGAFVLRDTERPCGFVTVVQHECSGWIGNLIVSTACRGRGLGALLFEHAAEELRRMGCRSLWLTASREGRPIYEKRGFRAVDGTVRWVLKPLGERVQTGRGKGEEAELLAGDRLVWGESRANLLSHLAAGGEVFSFGGTTALLQQGSGMQILGPWISPNLCPRENRQLLLTVLAAADAGEVVTDVLASSPVQPLLQAAGFERRGGCDLMVCGEADEVNLSSLVSFASLGSMG